MRFLRKLLGYRRRMNTRRFLAAGFLKREGKMA